MALTLGDRHARGRAGLPVARRPAAARRLVAPVLPGRPGRAGQARRQRHRLRGRRRVAPLAVHPRPRLRRDDVAGRRAGHRLGARPADASRARSCGPATPTARRGRSPCSPARRRSATACAAPSPSPSCSATSGPTGSCRRPGWRMSSATCPTRSRPSTAGRWTGTTRCSPASCWATPAASAWPSATRAFVMDGCGVRCVSDRPWVTAAETCEYAMANLAVGHDRGRLRPVPLGAAVPHRRRPLLDGHRVPRRGPVPHRRAVDLHGVGRGAGRRRPRRGAVRRPAGCSPSTTSCCPR